MWFFYRQYQDFLEDLEEDEAIRKNINIYKSKFVALRNFFFTNKKYCISVVVCGIQHRFQDCRVRLSKNFGQSWRFHVLTPQLCWLLWLAYHCWSDDNLKEQNRGVSMQNYRPRSPTGFSWDHFLIAREGMSHANPLGQSCAQTR